MGGRKRPISELRKENEDEGENLMVGGKNKLGLSCAKLSRS